MRFLDFSEISICDPLWKTGCKFLHLRIPFLRDQIDPRLPFFRTNGGRDMAASSFKGETLRCLLSDLQPQAAFSKKFLQPLHHFLLFQLCLHFQIDHSNILSFLYYPSSFSQSSMRANV